MLKTQSTSWRGLSTNSGTHTKTKEPLVYWVIFVVPQDAFLFWKSIFSITCFPAVSGNMFCTWSIQVNINSKSDCGLFFPNQKSPSKKVIACWKLFIICLYVGYNLARHLSALTFFISFYLLVDVEERLGQVLSQMSLSRAIIAVFGAKMALYNCLWIFCLATDKEQQKCRLQHWLQI